MKKRIGILVLVCALAAGIVIYLHMQSGRIDVMEGVYVHFSGVNGYGYVELSTDAPADTNETYRELKASNDADTMTFLNSLACSFQYEDGSEIEQGTLSNGDTVVYACTYDEEAGKKIGYQFTGTHNTYTAEGLVEAQTVDLFEGVTVSWVYEQGEMKAAYSLDNASDFIKDTGMEYDLAVDGDTAVLTALTGKDDWIAYGYVIAEDGLSKTYSIGTKPQPVTDYYNEAVLTAARETIDPLLEQAVSGCANILTRNGVQLEITGWECNGLEVGYGSSMNITYTVYTTGGNYLRGYSVDVFSFDDGSYRAYTDETEDTPYCEVTGYLNYWLSH